VAASETGGQQLEQNVSAAGWRLTKDELADIERLCALAGAPA
jgi:aryl-alcohol dehydrogenase-like predicted oxidoreductase